MSAPLAAGFAAAAAQGGGWAEVAKACADRLEPLPAGANLGFVYASDAVAPHLGSILTFLRERTRIADWVGSVGRGVCTTGEAWFEAPALAVLVAALPAESFRLFGPGAVAEQPPLASLSPWLARSQTMLGIVHGDPRAPDIVESIEGLARDRGLFLVGGLAAGDEAPAQIAGRVVEGGLSGVLLAPEISVVTGLTQGCSPIGPVRRISEAQGNVVMAIDERPALEVLKEDMGELLARDLRRVAGRIFAGFPVAGSDTGDYLVRNLMAIDVERQWLGIAHEVAAGEPLLFCRRDPASAAADLARMLGKLKQRAGAAPRAGLYFSCIGRGPNLFAAPAQELAMIEAALGRFPLAGFFGNGEIAHDRLYGYTGVLALFM